MTDGPTSDEQAGVALFATDGSQLATDALRRGLALLHAGLRIVVVTVKQDPDMSIVVGTGMAGGVMSMEERQELIDAQAEDGRVIAEGTVGALGLADDTESVVLRGEPAHEICREAEDRGAVVIVMGTRGHGGFRRAVLGSVSDHVVRHAPCPVLTIHDA